MIEINYILAPNSQYSNEIENQWNKYGSLFKISGLWPIFQNQKTTYFLTIFSSFEEFA